MRLLFDQNFSHRSPARLADVFADSAHVRPLGFNQASDEQIWEYGKTHGFCIVTQDSDFAERSRLHGSPPKVVWLRCGDATPQQVEAILRRNAALIMELIQNPVLGYLELV